MSDNLFSFPSESTGPAGVFGVFSDLGSDDSMEDPFAMPETAEPSESQSPEPEAGIQEALVPSPEQPPVPEAAGPVFAQLPLFSYNGNEEPLRTSGRPLRNCGRPRRMITRSIAFPGGVTTNLLDPCCGTGAAQRKICKLAVRGLFGDRL